MLINFYWSVDLKYCISSYCTAKWFSYTCTYTHFFFQILFSYRISHNIEQSSLCYTGGSCWLPVLYTVLCIFQSEAPNYPPPSCFFLGNHQFAFDICKHVSVLQINSFITLLKIRFQIWVISNGICLCFWLH